MTPSQGSSAAQPQQQYTSRGGYTPPSYQQGQNMPTSYDQGTNALYPGGHKETSPYAPPPGPEAPPADNTTAWIVGGVAVLAAAGLGYWLWTSQQKGAR